eukprot:458196-Prorocentrum_minimum.AAC.1
MYSPAAPSPASSRYGTVIVRLQCSYNTGYSTHATVHVQSSGARGHQRGAVPGLPVCPRALRPALGVQLAPHDGCARAAVVVPPVPAAHTAGIPALARQQREDRRGAGPF